MVFTVGRYNDWIDSIWFSQWVDIMTGLTVYGFHSG